MMCGNDDDRKPSLHEVCRGDGDAALADPPIRVERYRAKAANGTLSFMLAPDSRMAKEDALSVGQKVMFSAGRPVRWVGTDGRAIAHLLGQHLPKRDA